jgi:hypothetical protein
MSPAVLDPVGEPFAALPGTDSPAQPARVAERPVSAPDAVPALFEQVDPSTLQVVNCLFPRPTSGVAFLALLLQLAQIKQRASGEGFDQEMAVITVQSIRDLSRLIGWGYDTTHKYVVIFCALGLLTKRRANGKVELHFALVRYTPPLSLDALDRLIAQSRPKVQSYARKVRRRYLLLYGNDECASSPVCHPAESPIPELDEAIQQVQQLMERAASSVIQTDLAAVLTTLHRAQRRMGIGAGDSAPLGEQKKGRLRMHRGDSPPTDEQANGRLLRKTGDSSQSREPEKGRLLRPTGDSTSSREPENWRLLRPTGDSSPGSEPEKGRLLRPTGDSTSSREPENGRRLRGESPESAGPTTKNGRLGGKKSPTSPARHEANGRHVPQPGDSHAESLTPMGDSTDSAALNVNVSLATMINDSLNVNVKTVAAFLQTVFHEEPTKRGYYYHLHKQCPRPECWLAAAIKTLVGMHQTKTVKNPGRYFYDCCVRLHGDDMLPPEEQALVAQYAHLSYSQALAALTAPKVPATPSSTRPCGKPDQYEAFVARRRAELLAEFQARHPGVGPTSPPAGSDQYAAFVAQHTQELKATSAAKGA